MSNPDPPKKTYVRPDNTAVLTCEHCGIQRVVKADSFQGYKHKLKVKCSCNKVFTVNLEFRNRVRKVVHLRGTYVNHTQNDDSGDLIIQDLSVTGLSFTCFDLKKFNMGDEVTIEFALDDEHQTEVKKEVIIRNFRQRSIGCQYVVEEETFGSTLGYYIVQNI